MFRKRTRLTSQVWTVIFLLLFNGVLAQPTPRSAAKILLEEPIKLPVSERTILRKLVEDSKTKISASSGDEKQESILTNSTNFQDQIERTSFEEVSKQKELSESINDEKIETDEKAAISTVKTFDSLDQAPSADPSVKSKLSENNVNAKTSKLVPDGESLPKLSRNKGKPIFLDAFKEGSKHNVKKSETFNSEFEGTEDYEIDEHDLEHKEQTTPSTIKRKESLEDFDIESSKKDDKNHETDRTFEKDDKNDEKEEKNDDKEENLNEDDTFSLANDTNVNFNSQTSKNETNLISETDDSIDLEFGPKHDVEVVKNLTRSSIMRIVQAVEEKKSSIHSDKSLIDKKTNAKHDNEKNLTKKIDGESGDSAASVNDVDLKNDEKAKIDISSKPLPSTKIEISAQADIPLFKIDISSSKIDISGKDDAASSKADVMTSKTDIPSSEIHGLSPKTDRSSFEADKLPSKTDESSKINILPLKTDESSKLDILPSKAEGASKLDILPFKTDGSSKLDILPPKTDDSSSKIDESSFKEDPFRGESSSKISSSVSNSSWINELPKTKEIQAKESTENLTDSIKANDNVSPVPKARTISFSGINEFIPDNVDSKIVARTTESSPTKKPFNLDKEIEQRPYPYLKTDIKKTIDESEDANKATNFGKRVEESKEEVLAYENTIGQRGSDNKLVITEPSVLIDNSIQQFKPTYYKRSGNSTKLNSTISDFEMRLTTPKSIENYSSAEEHVSTSTVKLDFEEKEIIQKEVTDKDQRIYLTENGITETNLHNVSSNAEKDASNSAEKMIEITTQAITNKVSEKTQEIVAEKTQENVVEKTQENIADKDKGKIVEKDIENFAEKNQENVAEKNPEKIAEKAKENIAEKVKEKTTESPKKAETKLSLETFKTLDTLVSDEDTKVDALPSLEDPKLSFSPMNVTESSKKNSVTNKMIPENMQTIGTQTSTESSLAESTKDELITEGKDVLSTTQIVNFNKSQVHVNSVIPTSVEVPETTTTVEYEFIGLKETTLPGDKTDKDIEGLTVTGISTESYRSTVFDNLTNSGKLSNSDKTTDSGKSTDSVKSSDSGKLADSVKPSNKSNEFEKSTDSGRSSNSEESSTFSDVLNGEITESIVENITLNPSEETTTVTKETVTDESTIKKITGTSTDKSSEGRSTSEDKSFSSGGETMESDESTSFKTTTLIPNQETISFSAETTLSYDETTNLADLDNTSDGEVVKKSTAAGIDFTDSKASSKTPVSSKAPIKTTVDQQSITTDTAVISTSAPDPRIISVTSESTIVKTVTETTMQTLSPEDIKVFVRIIFEGNWSDVCPRLDYIREVLANLLNTEKTVMPKQVIFYQTQCSEGVMALTSLSSSEPPLTSLLIYIVDEDGNFDEPMTKLLPNLYKVSSPIDFTLPIKNFSLVQETDSGNAIAVVIVSSVAFICLLLLAGLLFIMRKRQTRFNYGERCRPVSLDAYSLDSVSAYNSVRRKGAIRASKRSYGNPTFEDSSAIPSHPLNFAGLSSFCNDVNAISEEFTGIPQITAKIDELPQGAEVKNRYANVIPLPETRVPLQRLNNDLLTEYINASYVRGPKNATKYYIACQAPTESTVTDFWRMIWEQQSKVIIMLTDLVENGVEKCSEYIPPSEVTDCHRLYGDYQVTLKKRETKEKYAISTLHLKNLENNTFREVSHIWYLWPTNGMPDSVSLIAVLLEARALQRGGPGAIVVHCSPGTGRTGTLIALDLGIRQYEITRTVDVPRVVYTIRRDRAGAVQTKEQYAFIYKALNLYATKLSGGALEST